MSTESRHCEATFSNVMEVFGDKLDELLGDPLLLDIPQHVTLDEVTPLKLFKINCFGNHFLFFIILMSMQQANV